MLKLPDTQLIHEARNHRCRSCHSSGLQAVLDYGVMPPSDAFLTVEQVQRGEQRYPLQLVLCEQCSLLQILETIDPTLLFSNDYVYLSSVSDSWLKHAKQSADEMVSRYKLGADSLVIEIASNDGYLLQTVKAHGVEVLGIDPAPEPARQAQHKGIETLVEFFTDELAQTLCDGGRIADVVVSNNVLAHVAHIHDFISGVRKILAADGVWIIEVPYVSDMVDCCAFDTVYHEHLCYFSVKSLQVLLSAHQLFIHEVTRLESHGGSLRLVVGHRDEAAPSVMQLLERERECGVNKLASYRYFAERACRVTQQISELLNKLAAQGKQLSAYGAAAKGTILLNCLGDAAQHINYVVDRNEHKQGKWMPGVRIPIVAPHEMSRRRPDYLLLLPWNLRREIIHQQRAYFDSGGKFILPLPLPTVLTSDNV